jgi:tripartite-type tricarboxylate transporter receptor subunit TctC
VLSAIALAAPTMAQPFTWKQLTIMVSFGPGGNYDVYARLLSRHIGKHLPGEPTVIVTNMPGAGGLTATNHLFNVAPKDGSMIGFIPRGMVTEPLLKKDSLARFQSDKFNWIGSMNKEVAMLLFWQTPPITLQDVLSGKEFTVGTTGVTSDGAILARMVNSLLGARLKVIPSYSGVPDILLAMERGELAGTAAGTLGSLQTSRADWLSSGKAKIVLQLGVRRDDALPDVPAIREYARSDDDRAVIDLLFSTQELGRPIVAPPGLPAERVQALRQAFVATMKDPEIVADAAKTKVELHMLSGDEVQDMIGKLVSSPPKIIEHARAIYEN